MILNFLKYIFVFLFFMMGGVFYYVVNYKVSPGLVSFGYEVIRKNETIVLENAINSIKDQVDIDRLERLVKGGGLKLNHCSIIPTSSFIDRIQSREHYYVLYYSGADAQSYELYAMVYVYYDGKFSVSDAGKAWHH